MLPAVIWCGTFGHLSVSSVSYWAMDRHGTTGISRICLVSASGQNAFFGEILGAFGAALREHGFEVEESVDCFPPPAEDLVCLFVPHEYSPLVHELARPSQIQLGRAVAICTEQPGTPWFEISCEIARVTAGAADINRLGAEEMRRRGIEAVHAPLGYVPSWDAWGGEAEQERSLDFVFLGGYTERRARALARCSPALCDRAAAIYLTETEAPHTEGSSYFLSHDRKWRLLADSRLILNIHRDDLAYMEWHRVIGAVLNGCVVLTEHALGVAPMVPGAHFLSTRYEDLPRTLEGLLDDRARLEEIRHAAYDFVREQMPMSAAIESLIPLLERAARSPVGEGGSAHFNGIPMPQRSAPRPPQWEVDADIAGNELPLRMGLKHLVVQVQGLRRQLAKLSTPDQPEKDIVENLGPSLVSPRVSVLLTIYNYRDCVGDALRSVALSDCDRIEVVAVDDASDDDSVDMVRSVSASLPWLPIKLVRRSRNRGLPEARNLATQHAAADLLFILDADNQVLPQGIEQLANALEDDPGAAFAYGIVEVFDSRGATDLMNWLDWDPARFRYGNYIDAMAMVRRSALEHLGGYSTDTTLYGWEDFALWVAMADAGMHGIRVPDFVARYRKSTHSMVSLTNIDSLAGWSTLLRKYPVMAGAPEVQP